MTWPRRRPTCRCMSGRLPNSPAGRRTCRKTRPPDSPGKRSNGGSAVVMAANLILAPEAERDIAEAYDWYEIRRAGLGEEFLSCVNACIQAITRIPELHGVVHEQYRRALVRR